MKMKTRNFSIDSEEVLRKHRRDVFKNIFGVFVVVLLIVIPLVIFTASL